MDSNYNSDTGLYDREKLVKELDDYVYYMASENDCRQDIYEGLGSLLKAIVLELRNIAELLEQ